MARAVSKIASKTGAEPSFASLGPTLLARKGGAKPAMRPQLAPLPDAVTSAVTAQSGDLEDLGWNDMGEADERNAAPLTKSKKSTQGSKPKPERKKSSKTIPRASKNKLANETKKPARRAAFTLRLDPDRHLKLRLAATMHGISAQSLVTEALDAMFGDIEDLDALANRMKRN